MEKKLVSFRLPDDLMQGLKAKAETEGVSVTELVCRFSRQGLQATTNGKTPTYTGLRNGTAPENHLDARERIARLEALVDPAINDRVAHLEGMIKSLLAVQGLRSPL
jgi:hypothetical protein